MTRLNACPAVAALVSLSLVAGPARAAEGLAGLELTPGAVVRITAPQTIDVPGLLKATPKRTVWSVKPIAGEDSLLAARVEGWAEPLATPRPGEDLRATLLSADASGLVVRPDGRRETFRIPAEAIAGLAVSRGRGSRAKQVLVGAAVGLGVGLAVSATFAASCAGDICLNTWGAARFVAPVFTIGGAITAGVTGGSERWEPVGRDRFFVALAPAARGGARLRIGVSF